ncbi:hypothetical protein QCA50_008179 [Cerrena zonata]|uniref:Glycoside hydrolase family 76 protein n=1 Tax=Cerrena zonata TaxID=2478898 RepID=A0AAW0G5J4_9APHY
MHPSPILRSSLMLYLVLSVLFALVYAQDYSIPTQWANTTSSLSRDARAQLAKRLYNTVNSSHQNSGQILSLGLGQNANLLSATVIYDSIVPDSQTNNYNVTSDIFLQAISLLIPAQGQQPFSNDPMMWGLTAVYAYRAYQQPSFLTCCKGISSIEEFSRFRLSVTALLLLVAYSGVMLIRLRKQIRPEDEGSGGIIAGGEGAYMALSAYLYDITDNQTFHDATVITYSFINSHLFNNTGNYVTDSFDVSTCVGDDPLVMTYNTGLYLEALSVFANKTSNSTLVQIADQLALSAIKSPSWTNTTSGILTDTRAPANVSDNSHSDTAYKGMLVRALYEHWSRSPPNSDIANLIKAYLMLQYNAVLNNARYPGTDYYVQSWTGPPVPSMLPWGQLAAADVLNSAIGLAADPSPIPIPSSSAPGPLNTSPSPSNARSHSLGPIIGGVVGGVLLVVLISVVILVIRYRRRRDIKYKQQIQAGAEYISNPFPPPLPIIDYFNSSKVRGEIQEPPAPALQEEPIDSVQPPMPQLPQSAPAASNSPSRDNIEDLVYRLNRAVARLPPRSVDGSLTTAPPRYEAFV